MDLKQILRKVKKVKPLIDHSQNIEELRKIAKNLHGFAVSALNEAIKKQGFR